MKKHIFRICTVLLIACFVLMANYDTVAEKVYASNNITASDLKGLSTADLISKTGALFTADQKKTGVLASVSMAQFILETGWGQSTLFQKANNAFGMKVTVSGNTWSGSTWDGKSKYSSCTTEYRNGKKVTTTIDFRSYKTFSSSIADHSAYLIGAMNGSSKRYPGISGMTDYKQVTRLIQSGGYASSTEYASKLNALIEKYNLTQFDVKAGTSASGTWEVTASALNVRASASTSSKKLGKLTKGQTVKILSQKGKWGKISYKGKTGWVYMSYLKKL